MKETIYRPYTIEHKNGREFGRYATKAQAMNALYLLEGTGARLISGGLCIADANHLPKRQQTTTKKRTGSLRLFCELAALVAVAVAVVAVVL